MNVRMIFMLTGVVCADRKNGCNRPDVAVQATLVLFWVWVTSIIFSCSRGIGDQRCPLVESVSKTRVRLEHEKTIATTPLNYVIMKKMNFSSTCLKGCFILAIGLMTSMTSVQAKPQPNESLTTEVGDFVQLKGKIVDAKTGTPLTFATVVIDGTPIGTVSNSEGDFALKVPEEFVGKSIRFSFLGYRDKVMPIEALQIEKLRIEMEALTVNLSEISVFPTDPYLLIKAVLKRKRDNYSSAPELMTAFYRETIKKRKTYASLSEAVVEVYKQSYSSDRDDQVRLLKGRKSDNYQMLDTLVFKLMGGPIATLSLDLVKNPYMVLDDEMVGKYEFRIGQVNRINDRLIYVLEFAQKPEVDEPLLFGKIYIDTESLAITGAQYQVNTSNRAEVAKLFIRKKPVGADAYPTEAIYRVTYAPNAEGKWAYAYSRGDIAFKVDWKKRWFNTYYYTSIEMAATNWSPVDETKSFKPSDRIKMNVVMTDAVTGFNDVNFWGAYNVIEPEKTIENAIKKIRKNMDEIQ